jgi:UDP-glucuronate decarboxylase
VDDLVSGFLAFMDAGPEVHGPINLGNPNEFTIKELAEKVLAKVGGKSKLVHKALPQDDPMQRQPNISTAKEVLGWEPRINLDEGLDRTIAYFRKVVANA